MNILNFEEFINESVWYRDEYGDEYFDPSKDGRYKYLLKKPINKLTKNEMLYLYAIHFTKTSNGYYYDYSKYENFEDYVNSFLKDRTDFELDDAFDFFSKLKFPLKLYRALRDDETIENISGKKSSLSWTTDLDIYKNDLSKFKNCTKIVEAEITPDMIQNEWTIVNYTLYSSKTRLNSKENIDGYPENEITLKPRFKNLKLMNLKYIDKNNI